MEILGRDIYHEAYRIAMEVDGVPVLALVPERMMESDWRASERPSHEEAYTWIARHRTDIEHSIERTARGGPAPRPPFDQITLVKEP